LKITADADWDTLLGNVLPAGNGRVVANWKIADLGLSENAEVTELVLTNTVGALVTPENYHFSNFELFHDGVKVATAATMGNSTVTFGDGETTMFTVTDGDTVGKTLVVKADISSDVDKNDELDLQITAFNNLKARGASTGQPIYLTQNALEMTFPFGLANNKVLKQNYATITMAEGVATNVASGTSNELLRFTVTPQANEALDLRNLTIVLKDQLGTTAGELLSVYDVTNSDGVLLTVPGGVAINNGVANGEATLVFDGADLDNISRYGTLSTPVTFSVRADTAAVLGTSNGSYQIGIKYVGDTLQVSAPAQEGVGKGGFAPLGDKITGPTVTATN
jgi:hypothetical protein